MVEGSESKIRRKLNDKERSELAHVGYGIEDMQENVARLKPQLQEFLHIIQEKQEELSALGKEDPRLTEQRQILMNDIEAYEGIHADMQQNQAEYERLEKDLRTARRYLIDTYSKGE